MIMCGNKTCQATKIYDFMNYHMVFFSCYLSKMTLYNTVTSTFELIKGTLVMQYQAFRHQYMYTYHYVLVKAVDGDRGINNRITYSIIQGSQGCFDIDANTGVIYTLKRLDRESPLNSNGAYILQIMVRTCGAYWHQSTLYVPSEFNFISKRSFLVGYQSL
jgi:hypothetical protein